MGKFSVLPLPNYFTVMKSKINHYTLPIPQVAVKENLNTKDVLAKNLDFVRQKQFKLKDQISLKQQLSEDTLTLSKGVSKVEKPKTLKNDNFIKGDKLAMEEYFNSGATKETNPEKYSWYEEVAQEYDAKAKVEAEKFAAEAKESNEYWQAYSKKKNDDNSLSNL